jgi:tetratricopeptide (TPR) repeat protein
VNERKPRRPADGPKRSSSKGASSKRTSSARDGARRSTRAGGAPKTQARSGGKPARAGGASSRDGGAKKKELRSDGTPRRAAPRKGAGPKRDGPKRDGPRRDGPKSDARGGGGSGRELRRDGPQKRSARGGPAKRGGSTKRTSRNTDERNPTHSGVDYPSPKYRRKNEETLPVEKERSSLRKVRRPTAPVASRPKRERKGRAPAPTRRRKVRTTEAGEELGRIAGRGARHAQLELARAAEAFTAGRERDAARLLRPLRDAYPDASAVRELLGLSQYRLGQYAAATKELDAFVELTNSVEQHPVLMDCARALGKHRRVEELWEELATASPSGALVTEGRIVLAGSRADQGRLTEAIATLDRRGGTPNRVQDHHVRVWYALADLYERAGDLPKARELFLRIRSHDAGFADVAERLAALG